MQSQTLNLNTKTTICLVYHVCIALLVNVLSNVGHDMGKSKTPHFYEVPLIFFYIGKLMLLRV